MVKNNSEKEYACYYSPNDLSIGWNLELAENCIDKFSKGYRPNNLSDIIELWHVCKLIDTGFRLNKWTDLRYQELTSEKKEMFDYFIQTIHKISTKDKELQNEYDHLYWGYLSSFWDIIENYKLFNNIDKEFIISLASEDINNLRSILKHKRLTEHFKDVLKEELLKNPLSAELLIAEFVKNSISSKEKMFFPTNLNIKDKENIINSYLDSDNPNLNFVRIITQVKDDKNKILLSPTTRLKAKKLEKRLNNELMKDSRAVIINTSFSVEWKRDEQLPPKTFFQDEKENSHIVYNRFYIEKCDNFNRILAFANLFEWFSHNGLITLISKPSECEIFELLIFDKADSAYPDYSSFNFKKRMALGQIISYDVILHQLGSSLEQEIKQYYEKSLLDYFGYKGLPITLPNENTSWLGKCREICPEIDALALQYNDYACNGNVDAELIKLEKPMKMENCLSLLKKKYYQINNDNSSFKSILNYLFSSQSMLFHIDPYKKENFHNFVQLMRKHQYVNYSNYSNYQKPNIDLLIKNKILKKESDGKLQIANYDIINAFEEIYENGACSYWHYSKETRKELDQMQTRGWLVNDDHLLCESERDYFSYYLDNKKFTNGPALRNKYLHGNIGGETSDSIHKESYYILLSLLVNLILKITDDLLIAQNVFNENNNIVK
jgi:hypothetical protein